MTKAYYTLCQMDEGDGVFYDGLGSYKKGDVEAEKRWLIDNGAKAKDFRIIRTDGSAADLIAKLKGLNSK